MVTPLNDVASLHDQYFMGIHHSRQAVRNDQGCFVLSGTGQLGLNSPFIGRVECRGSFVKDQNGRVFEQGSGNGHALLFSARKFQAAFTHGGGIALRGGGNEIVNACRFGGGFNFFLG